MSFVHPEKQERIRRFYRWEDSLRSLFADLLSRRLIIDKLGIKNRDISFSTNEFGKPFLKDFPGFHFNLSHSGRWVVCSVDKQPVGIDVEEIQTIDLDISKNYFSPDEHMDLMKMDDKMSYFFTLWTLKESYIKIVGKGLSLPLNSFSIRFLGDSIRIKAENEFIDNIFFTEYSIHSDYKMSACAFHNDFPDKVISITPSALAHSFLETL